LWPGRNACGEPARAIPLMAHALVLSFAQRTRLPACRRHPGVSSSFPATRPGAFPGNPATTSACDISGGRRGSRGNLPVTTGC